jgi:hypothetical protein
MESFNYYLDTLLSNQMDFFLFMKKKYPVYKESNIFLRDLQYAIYHYFLNKSIQLKYSATEKLASEFASKLLSEEKLKKISNSTWKLNFSVVPAVIEIK